MKHSARTFDIAIVGGGIVGLACALALAQQGLQIVLIESGEIKARTIEANEPFDAKIVAITRSSEQLFEQLGVWQAIIAMRVCAYQRMKVWDKTADGQITFCAEEFFEPNLGHMIEQQVILAALWQKLQTYANVHILAKSYLKELQFTEQQVELRLAQGEALSATLIIAADGENSTVRNLCHIPSKREDYHQDALVAIVEGTYSHDLTAFQRFDREGSLALLPLAQLYQCAIVWAMAPEQAQNLCEQAPDQFNSTLERACDSVMGKMTLVSKRFIFPLKTHHAKKYSQARCVLIGDAAHTLHPLAGQGVNLGLLDVIALVDILINAQKKQRDIGALNILQRYERARRCHNQIMIRSMKAFKQGFMSSAFLTQYLRNRGLNWVDRHRSIKQIFVNLALGN